MTSRVWVFGASEIERSSDWLPLEGGPWTKAVLKPNWVRDFNELDRQDASLLAHTVTAPDLLLAIATQLGTRAKKLIVADAPQFDTNWERLCQRLNLPAFTAATRARGLEVEIRDLRQEVVRTDDNDVILQRFMKNGDPEGYRIVDVGRLSAFMISEPPAKRLRAGTESDSLRGADYDARVTIRHHSNGRHEYCVAGTILGADLVVNVPKIKTHKKSGVTLCLKNLVGINGNKNYLPHHRAGSPQHGGDEFPGSGASLYRRTRAWAIDRARPLLNSSVLLPLIRQVRALDVKTRPTNLIRNGNWWGNNTIWRTILDLNRALIYADSDGRIQRTPQRTVFHVMDGIAAGEGDGPMAATRKDMGLVIASSDPVAADMTASALMGFDPFRIPVIRNACEPHELPITNVTSDGGGLEILYQGRALRDWRELPNLRFRPHPGWAGHIERTDGGGSNENLRTVAS